MRRAALVLFLAAFATGLFVGSSAGSSSLRKPKQIGPKVTVFSGSGWSLVAWQSDHGLCVAFGAPGSSSAGCSHPYKPIQMVLAASGGQSTRVIGSIAANVARLDVKQPSGKLVAARLSRSFKQLRTNRRFFVTQFHATARQRWMLLAYDAHAKLLQRIP